MPRYAARITPEELSAKLSKLLKVQLREEDELDDEEMAAIGDDCFLKGDLGSPYAIRDLSEQITKDLSKVMFDFENCECEPGSHGHEYCYGHLLGPNTLDTGLTFIGFMAGGDWEEPVFFILYWDGKKIRAYIPKDGNLWNKKTKTAYGSEQEQKELTEDEEEEYEEERENAEIDKEAIIEDIKKRVQVK